ncbi:hypothetical protein SAMN05519103_01443 [Rhizobiales bacterium GAS113]|nr:hypothetical protein SAMN05519103_01443 [Rhizobiales bacterium GAS113]
MRLHCDRRSLIGGLLAARFAAAPFASAATDRRLRVGLGSAIISLDPHFTLLSSNAAVASRSATFFGAFQ